MLEILHLYPACLRSSNRRSSDNQTSDDVARASIHVGETGRRVLNSAGQRDASAMNVQRVEQSVDALVTLPENALHEKLGAYVRAKTIYMRCWLSGIQSPPPPRFRLGTGRT